MPKPIHLEQIPYLDDGSTYFDRLSRLPNPVWLDSGRPHADYGRFDIITASPRKTLINPSLDQLRDATDATLWNQLRSEDKARIRELELPFVGGVIGFFEYSNHQFSLTNTPPEGKFGVYDWAVIQDHTEQKAYLFALPNLSSKRLESIKQTLFETSTPTPSVSEIGVFNAAITKSEYIRQFDKIKRYILEGDTYQINFAQRFSAPCKGRAETMYLYLRKVLPSPFCAFLNFDEQPVLSFSPERFISIKDRVALTQPIKGTIARGATPEADQENIDTLVNSEKNRAENVMIVDLLRNDFSKTCLPHSVKTSKLCDLESYPNVHHLVSTIEGELAPQTDMFSFFLHCFPGGSITGAPKRRAMDIIQQVESAPRNAYCGSILYASIDGQMDSNILIRTLQIHEGQIDCWGGGGIVADSDADEEYQESLDKVSILLNALQNKVLN